MKNRKMTIGTILMATALLITSCGSKQEGGSTETTSNTEAFDLFKKMTEVRTNADPQKGFQELKAEYLKGDNPLTLQFILDYVNDKQATNPSVDLKLVNINGDQITVSGDGNLSDAENTLIVSTINCTPDEIKRMPRALKAGLNFINKEDMTNIYPVTDEFKTKVKEFNKKQGYEVLSPSGMIENEIAYFLTGNYRFYDATNSYSTEEAFEKSKYSDDIELAKFKFYLSELENGSLNFLYKLYQGGKIAIVDYEEANQKDAVNPKTIITVNGGVNTADFQFPLTSNRQQTYGKLMLGMAPDTKITDIRVMNKNYEGLIKGSSVTGNGIEAIKKKLDFYAKNKPNNTPNEDAEKDESWADGLNK